MIETNFSRSKRNQFSSKNVLEFNLKYVFYLLFYTYSIYTCMFTIRVVDDDNHSRLRDQIVVEHDAL